MGKRENKGVLMIIATLLMVALFIGSGSVAYAKKGGFKHLTWQDLDNGKVVKIGAYSFKQVSGSTYFKKTKAAGAFKKAPFSITSSCTNGKVVYYIDKMVLKKYTLSSGKIASVKKIPKSPKEDPYDPDHANVDHVKGNNIYISRTSWGEWGFRTFIYNTKTKKLTKSFAGAISIVKGDYMLLDMKFRTDVSPAPYLLCKISGSKLKKVKQLTPATMGVTLVGNKFYYLEYTDKKTEYGYTSRDPQKGTLYCCNVNGNKRVKLGRFVGKQKYGQIFVSEITSKDCKIMLDGVNYRYNYKTKKKTKIAN